MMINKNFCCSIALVLPITFFLSGAASAKDSGAYLGVAAGQSHFDLGDVSGGIDGFPVTFSKDESSTASSFALGYRFNPYIAIEGSYADYGKATISADSSFTQSGVLFTEVSADVTAKGGAAALVVALPAGNWEFAVRLGAFFANTKLSAHVRGTTTTSPVQTLEDTESESASTTETLAGIGLGYTVANHYHFKLEWTRIPDVGDKNKTGEGDVTALTLGFQYRF